MIYLSVSDLGEHYPLPGLKHLVRRIEDQRPCRRKASRRTLKASNRSGGRQMPITAVETEVIEDVVRTACRAPSLHNSQPWQWATAVIPRSKSSNGLTAPPERRSLVAAPRSTICGWRWPRPGGNRTSNDFLIPTGPITWHQSNSPQQRL